MSWSVSYVGKPDSISKALTEHASKLTGPSKTEFDAVLPHIKAILAENFNKDNTPMMKVFASGHGYSQNGEDKQRTASVTIETVNGTLV